LGSGTILREVEEAANLLRENHDVDANIWSVTSFNELNRDAQSVQRWNMLHPEQEQRKAYITQQLDGAEGPVIAATDYMKSYAEQVHHAVKQPYVVLGTDGFGRSDTRQKLRHFFEVDRHFIVIATLKALADADRIAAVDVSQAMQMYGIDPEKIDPWSC
jgi:pyruvate dehydrogenase E1 component